MSYTSLVAKWDQDYGRAYTLASFLPPVMPNSPVPRGLIQDPVQRAAVDIQALGLVLVADPAKERP